MNKENIPKADYQRLVKLITNIIYNKGLKATTMDSVAAELGISKRTLYEIFGSKNNMICEVFDHAGRTHQEYVQKIFDTHTDMLEAIIELFKYHRNLINELNVNFLSDLDTFYREVREDYDEMHLKRQQKIIDTFMRGVKQGVFRSDINYKVLERIRCLEIFSLKRAEEFYGREASTAEILDCINVAFLRSIVHPDHMGRLDRLLLSCGLVDNPYTCNSSL